jgi:hypothetical protein
LACWVRVEGGNGVLAHGFLIFRIKLGVLVLDDLAHANLRQFLGHQFFVEQAALDGGLVLNEGGDHLVQVFLANARGFLALGFGEALDLDLELSGLVVETDIALAPGRSRPRRSRSLARVRSPGSSA